MTQEAAHPKTEQAHIFSRSLQIRTTITKITAPTTEDEKNKPRSIYEIISYQWTENPEEPENPLWEKIADPITCEDFTQAEHEAQKQCDHFSGEVPEENIPAPLQEIIQENTNKDFQFLKPNHFNYQDQEQKLQKAPQRLLSIDEFFLLEYPGYWNIGILLENNQIQSWQKFDHIKEALQTINKLTEEE